MSRWVRLPTAGALGILLAGLPAGRADADPTPAAQSAANGRFAAGKKLAEAHRCREAVVELQASLDVIPSPNTRLLLGRCYVELGQVATAHLALSKAATEGRELADRGDARYRTTAEFAAKEADAIAPRVPRITLVLPPDAPTTLELALDGAPLATSALGTPLELDPGPHTLETKGAGVTPRKQTFEAHEQQKETVNVVVEKGAAGADAGGNEDAWAVARKRAAVSEGTGKSVEQSEEEGQTRSRIAAAHAGFHYGFAAEFMLALSPGFEEKIGSGTDDFFDEQTTLAQVGLGGAGVAQYGLAPAVDFRATAFTGLSGPNFALYTLGVSAGFHFNLGSIYTMSVGLRGGLDVIAGSNGASPGPFIGPDFSVIGFRFGDLRQYSLELETRVPVSFYNNDSSGFKASQTIAWAENALVLTYLFLTPPKHSAAPPTPNLNAP